MSFAGEAFKLLKDVVLMNERIERLSHAVEQLEHARRASHERLVRVETFIEYLNLARGQRRPLPPS